MTSNLAADEYPMAESHLFFIIHCSNEKEKSLLNGLTAPQIYNILSGKFFLKEKH
jgi:hypothetical protein